MRLSISQTPSNTPSNTPTNTNTGSPCPTPSPTSICLQGTGLTAGSVVKLVSSGSTVYIGAFGATQYNGTPISNFFSINQNGSLSLSAASVNSQVGEILLQTDGKIMIGGDFTSVSGVSRNNIARMNANGTLDTTFVVGTGFGGPAITIQSINKNSSGDYFVGGQFTSYSGVARNNIIKLKSNGSVDNTFSVGAGTSSLVQSILVQPDDKVIITGWFVSYSSTTANRIVRLNTNGTIDNTFNSGTGFNNDVWHAITQPDGKIVCVGSFGSYNGTPVDRMVRLNSGGTIDTSFTSLGFNDLITDVAIDVDGNYIVAGRFTTYNGITQNRIVKLNPDGTLFAGWNSGSGLSPIGQRALATFPDKKIMVGGGFNQIYNGYIASELFLLNEYGTFINCDVIPITPTRTPTATPTPEPSPEITPTNTTTQTNTPSMTATQTITPTPSATPPIITPSNTATQTNTPSMTATQTITPTPSSTIVLTTTPTPSITATQTPSNTTTQTPSQTTTNTQTATQTITPTPSPTKVASYCIEAMNTGFGDYTFNYIDCDNVLTFITIPGNDSGLLFVYCGSNPQNQSGTGYAVQQLTECIDCVCPAEPPPTPSMTQTSTETPNATPTSTIFTTPTQTPSTTLTNTPTPSITPTISVETCAFLTVRTDGSLDVPITDVEVNSVPVSYLSGDTFPIIPSDPPGYYNTTQTGASQTVVVNYGSNIAGQRIELIDCNAVVYCCDLNPGGGTCTFTGVDLSCNCNWEIQAYDGTC